MPVTRIVRYNICFPHCEVLITVRNPRLIVEDRTLKQHISIGVFVVYIDTGSSVPGVLSKSCDLARLLAIKIDKDGMLHNTVVSNHFHSVKILLFSSARSHDFDRTPGTICLISEIYT
jgi:hypothetical protein